MPRAEQVIVVSLHKSGTHLIDKVMRTLGYQTTGAGLGNVPPHWLDPAEQVPAAAPPAEPAALPAMFANMPANSALFLHDLPLRMISPALARAWTTSHYPPVIFNFRDPRDVLLSLIDYSLKPELQSKGFANATSTMMSIDILQNYPPERRVSVAIQWLDSYFSTFETSKWLLLHPKVCKVRFEHLVGPKGGGSTEFQLAQIREIQTHLGITGDAEPIAAQAFDPTTRTFSKGRAYRWKEEFSVDDLAGFESKYGALRDLYGYEPPMLPQHANARRTA